MSGRGEAGVGNPPDITKRRPQGTAPSAGRVFHPRWARVEHLRYMALCWPCYDQLDERFTVENAIAHALVICAVHQVTLAVQR